MAEFIFQGKLTLSGVTFFVQANDEADAIKKAKKGDYTSYEIDAAASDNWMLDPSTCESNE